MVPDPVTGHVGAFVLISHVDSSIVATVDFPTLQVMLASATGLPQIVPATDPLDQTIIQQLYDAYNRFHASNENNDQGHHHASFMHVELAPLKNVAAIATTIDTEITPEEQQLLTLASVQPNRLIEKTLPKFQP